MEKYNWEKEYFKLLDEFEELKADYDILKDKYDELVKDMEENYVHKPENPYDEYGLDESDFH